MAKETGQFARVCKTLVQGHSRRPATPCPPIKGTVRAKRLPVCFVIYCIPHSSKGRKDLSACLANSSGIWFAWMESMQTFEEKRKQVIRKGLRWGAHSGVKLVCILSQVLWLWWFDHFVPNFPLSAFQKCDKHLLRMMASSRLEETSNIIESNLIDSMI